MRKPLCGLHGQTESGAAVARNGRVLDAATWHEGCFRLTAILVASRAWVAPSGSEEPQCSLSRPPVPVWRLSG